MVRGEQRRDAGEGADPMSSAGSTSRGDLLALIAELREAAEAAIPLVFVSTAKKAQRDLVERQLQAAVARAKRVSEREYPDRLTGTVCRHSYCTKRAVSLNGYCRSHYAAIFSPAAKQEAAQ